MFSDKERESWQNIKAPASLLEKTAMQLDKKPCDKAINYKKMLMPLVAACFVVVIVAVFIMMTGGADTRIYVGIDGKELTTATQSFDLASEPMPLSRTSDSSVFLTLEPDGKTEVTTSDGSFSIIQVGVTNDYDLNSYEAESKTLIHWTYPIPSDGEYVTLSIKTGKTVQTVRIWHDTETGVKNVTLIKK